MRRLLVLGGTGFLGHAIVQAALTERAAGTPAWSVTTFNRGLSGPDDPAVHAIRGDRYEVSTVSALTSAGPWDAVIDCSGFVPWNVLSVAETLSDQVGRYVFVSSVSAYAKWPVEPLTEDSAVLEAPPDAGPEFGSDTEDGPTRYGYQKAGCEAAVRSVLGDQRTAVLRPGVILGPREYVGRLLWWLRRFADGSSPVIGPGTPDRAIQPIDVRDVARFAVRCAGGSQNGAYNVTAPIGAWTFGDLLDACRQVTGQDLQVRWVPDDLLLAAGVRQWSELPLWRVPRGVWAIDSSRAAADGLQARPLGGTVADTWAWMQSSISADNNERSREVGMTWSREAEVLSRLAVLAGEPGLDRPG